MRAAIKKVITLDFGRSTAQPAAVPALSTATLADTKGIALLITRDALSLKWAPRWLQNAGLDVRIADTADEAVAIATAERPSLMIADAAITGDDGRPLIESLRKVHGKDVPLIALCANNADVNAATDAEVTDIARRPYDWQVITQRAARVLRAHEMLAELRSARDALESMRVSARAARRDRAKVAELDRLTGLPNVERFLSLLHRAVATRPGTRRNVGVLVVGLDRYRMVNEAVGRENANRLLKLFADRLRSVLSDREVIGGAEGRMVTAVAARLRGARFAMLVSNAQSEDMIRFKQAILHELEQPFEVSGQSVYLTASIGAASFPQDCADADGLLHCAETAMLDAQESGSVFQFFRQPKDSASARILNLDRMLREAMRNDDLELAYQPIADAASGKIVAAEALLRWHHEDEGAMSPSDFVPVAEKSGLMREIGEFVLNTACAQLRSWLDSGMEPIRMAVNLSLCQLVRSDVAELVAAALENHRLEPELLEIELSERGVLNQRPEVVKEICRLKALGVRISIDDFGTGQAAIGYLKDLPVDVIKIDRCYVSGAARSERDEAIASGMVALAHRLKASVVAEGVETREQLEMLRSWGSEECQGFLFSPAVTAAEFLSLARSFRPYEQ